MKNSQYKNCNKVFQYFSIQIFLYKFSKQIYVKYFSMIEKKNVGRVGCCASGIGENDNDYDIMIIVKEVGS